MSSLKQKGQVLIFRPPDHRKEIYFRALQTKKIFEQKGYQVHVIAGRGKLSYLWALLQWPIALLQAQIVFVYPQPLMSFYIFMAFFLKRIVVIDHYTSYISLKNLYWWGHIIFPFEKIAYQQTPFILSHTISVTKQLCQTFNLQPSQVHTLYSVVDIDHFAPIYQNESNLLREKLGVKDEFVVFYHGKLHTWHGVDILREAVKQLVESGESIILIILAASRQGYPHERWLAYIPYLELPAYIQLGHIWCSGFVNLERGDRSFSSTMIQALAMAQIVLTSPSPEKNRFLEDGRSVIYVTPDDPTALSQSILKCKEHYESYKKIGQAGRQVAIEHFSEQQFINFIDLVSKAYINSIGGS